MSTLIIYLADSTAAETVAEYVRLRDSCEEGYRTRFVGHLPTGEEPTVPEALRDDFEPIDDAQLLDLGFPDFNAPQGVEPRPPVRIVPGNVDFMLLGVQRRHPEHAHYWLIESDVRFSGNWAELFRRTSRSPADLLATCFVDEEEDPDWPWWQSLRAPAGESPELIRMRCYCPIFRISRRGCELLTTRYREGWCGHAETLMPSLLRRERFLLEDLDGRGSFRRADDRPIYRASRLDPNLFPGTLRYRPIRARPGRRPDTLWHPVKPRAAAEQGRWRLWRQTARAVARHLFWRLIRGSRRLTGRPRTPSRRGRLGRR